MSRLLKVVCDVAEIRGRYLHIHDEIFNLSARKLMRALSGGMHDLYTGRTGELDGLSQRLMAAQAELKDLDDSDLSVRRARKIQAELGDYVAALIESIRLLKSICALDQTANEKSGESDGLQGLKLAYDDAVQYQKRLGARLNALISAT